jgi:hypothetical protein
MHFQIEPLSSGGLILSYQCSNECRHCLYACAPNLREWISETDLNLILKEIRGHNRYLTGLHFAGGEPFLNPDLIEYAIRKAILLGLPVDYVETNGFWCREPVKTRKIMERMKEAGLRRILVSCSPFHQEFIPFESVKHAVEAGQKVFGPSGVVIYTSYFFQQFMNIDSKYPLPLEQYIEAIGAEEASVIFASEYGLIPNGRAATRLAYLYAHRPASAYFGETCKHELSSPHHIHIDLYGHYIAGLCAGLSVGDAHDLDSLYHGIDLSQRPILRHLVEGGVEALFRWAVKEAGYIADLKGYIAKCHLCLDIRRHLVKTGRSCHELAPEAFYEYL